MFQIFKGTSKARISSSLNNNVFFINIQMLGTKAALLAAIGYCRNAVQTEVFL
jgi:hypothetical protein